MAKASFPPAYRMKEVVLLEPKNLGRIILDKVPGVGRGTKCRRRSLGRGGWRLAPGGFCLTSVVPLPLSTPRWHAFPCDGSNGSICFVPLCLFSAERSKGLRSVGQKRVAGHSRCPPVQSG